MTDTNSTPTPPGDSASGGHTPASQQPVPLQPTQPAPYSAQGAQPITYNLLRTFTAA